MAAGLAQSLPAPLRALAALVVLLVLPAVLLAGAGPLSRRRPELPALHLSIAFVVWLCVLAVWTTLLSVAGASFRTYAVASTWLLVAAYGAALLRSLRGGANLPAPRIARGWWILLAVCAMFAAAIPFRESVGEDGLDHVGYVRRILTDDALRPAGVLALPFGENPSPSDPRKGALHGVLALVCWIADTDAITVWRWLPAVMFPAAVLAALAFNGAFLNSPAARVAAAVLVLLSFNGNPFRFAGASGHGESLAALWCWVLAALAVAGGAARTSWGLWILLAAGGVMIHLGVAMHVLVLAATVACLGRAWGIARRERMMMCISMLAGAAVAMALRHGDLGGGMNIIHSHTQGVLFVHDGWFVASPMDTLRRHGMLFLGGLVCVPVLAFAVRSRPAARAILAAAAIPFAVAFVPWIATLLYRQGSYMVFRALLFVPVYAAMVECARMLGDGVRRRDRRAWLAGVPAALIWLLVFLRPVPGAIANDLGQRVSADDAAPSNDAALIQAVAALPAGSVVLSDPATSYVLCAHTSHRFVAVHQQHGNPRDSFALERIRAVRDVLSPFATPDVAVAACRRFNVNYVVVNGSPPGEPAEFLGVWQREMFPLAASRMVALDPSFAPVDTAGGAIIYRFHGAAPVPHRWTIQDRPVALGAPPLSPCQISAPRDAFRVTGVSVSPERALPGDTLEVTIGYRRDAPVPFQFPVVMHLRFDHDVVAREFPGEKQWRRYRDGREGKRSRFRHDFFPGHGVYEPDLWPVGFELCETFTAVVPREARRGRYRVEVSIEALTQVPNFHLRDLLFNRDHYSGIHCATLDVVDHVVGSGDAP